MNLDGEDGKDRHAPILIADRALGAVAASVLFAMMVVTVIDVTGRYVFAKPLPGGFELTQVLLAQLIFVGLPLVTARGGHVTITLTDRWFSPFAASIRDRAVNLVCAMVTAGIAWRLWLLADRLGEYGDIFEFIGLPKAFAAYSMSLLAGLTAFILLGRTFAPGQSKSQIAL